MTLRDVLKELQRLERVAEFACEVQQGGTVSPRPLEGELYLYSVRSARKAVEEALTFVDRAGVLHMPEPP